MNYLRFIEQLLELYENWRQSSIHPKPDQFQAIVAQIQGKTTDNIMQLLNWAVECMEPGEIYCQICCFEGANLIGALLNHPDSIAYAVDKISEFNANEESIEQLTNNLSLFNLEPQVVFGNQDFEEFLFDLRELQAEYIEIAVELGLAQEWRQSIINKIKQSQDRVYEDKTCVEALEEFYQRVVQEGQLANTTI